MEDLTYTCPQCNTLTYIATNHQSFEFVCPKCMARRALRISKPPTRTIGLSRDPLITLTPRKTKNPLKKPKPLPGAAETVYIEIAKGKVQDILKFLQSAEPALFQGCSQGIEGLYMILDRTFSNNVKQSFVISNHCYQDSYGNKRNSITIRTTNSAFLHGRIDARQLRLDGHIGSKSVFIVEHINVVSDSNLTQSEKKVGFSIIRGEPEKANNYIWTLINETLNYSDTMQAELQEWSDYLSWKEKIIQMKIAGIKYIAFRDYEDEDGKLGISFLAVAADVPARRKIEKILDREELSIVPFVVSKDRWVFNYDYTGKGKNERGTNLKMISYDRLHDIGKGWDNYRKTALRTKGKDSYYTQFSTDDSLQRIQGNREYRNPQYLEIHFELPPYMYREIARSNMNDEQLENYMKRELFSKLHFDGFIVTARVGDFVLNNRLKNGLQELQAGRAISPNLAHWIFDIKKARTITPVNRSLEWSEWGRDHLNDSQKKAVINMLQAPDVFLCQGPPGTGKTTVIAEAVYQLTRQGKRVLIASQTNLAVNNALSKLITNPSIRAVRLGDESKIDDSVEHVTDRNILKTFFRGVRDDVRDRYLNPWEKMHKELEELQEDDDYAVELCQTQTSLKRQQNILEVQLTKCKDQIAETLKKEEDPQTELNQLKLEQYRKYLNDLDEQIIPSEKIIFSKDAAKQLYQEFAHSMEALAEKGYHLIPAGVSLDNGYSAMTSAEIRNSLRGILGLHFALRQPIVGNDESKLLRIRELKSEREEIIYDGVDQEDFNRLAQINAELKELEKGGWSKQTIEVLPEQYREKEQDGALPEEQTKIIYDEASAAVEQMVETLKQFLKNQIIFFEEISNDAEQQVFNLRQQAEQYSKQLKLILADIEGNTAELAELAENYGCDANKIHDVIRKRRNSIMKQYNTGLPESDFQAFLSQFCGYVDSVGDDYSLENEVYLSSFINACNVVGISCTENSLTLSQNGFESFDVAIIDEVSKATPPEILLPLLIAEKAILVGDHRQLPPLFGEHNTSYQEYKNEIDEEDKEAQNLLTDENYHRFEKLVTNSLFRQHYEQASGSNKRALLVQYRMHREIMDLVNMFYDGRLEAGLTAEQEAECKAHKAVVRSTVGNAELICPEHHAYWIDSSSFRGRDVYEDRKKNGTSMFNRLEVAIITETVKQINQSYEDTEQPIEIGIISFYMDQVKMIREELAKCNIENVKYEVNTVDRFQGKEKPIVLVSLVRNVRPGRRYNAAYVNAFERINVAMSRAQSLLLIAGAKDMYAGEEISISDMETGKNIHKRRVYNDMIEKLSLNGCYFTADDLLDSSYGEYVFASDTENKLEGYNLTDVDSSDNENEIIVCAEIEE